MLQGVKHIIFDLGGVILNIDYQRTIQEFTKYGIENFDEIYSQAAQSDLFDKLEKGQIGKDDFVKGLQALSGKHLTEAQIIGAWNSLILDFPLRRLQILQQLRLYYDLFLLSNTNEIHELAFNKLLNDTHGMPSLGVFFDKVYLSHRVGMRKPDKEIFEKVLDDNGLKAEHTLFIDDSPQHIETANSLGIQTIYLEKGMTIEDDIFLPKK
jgi:glucose-1-phosphatase